MSVLPKEKIEELEETLPELDIEAAMNYSLADAIRDGATGDIKQARAWVGKNGSVCALSLAAMVAKARRLL
jgi:hypothetical protein